MDERNTIGFYELDAYLAEKSSNKEAVVIVLMQGKRKSGLSTLLDLARENYGIKFIDSKEMKVSDNIISTQIEEAVKDRVPFVYVANDVISKDKVENIAQRHNVRCVNMLYSPTPEDTINFFKATGLGMGNNKNSALILASYITSYLACAVHSRRIRSRKYEKIYDEMNHNNFEDLNGAVYSLLFNIGKVPCCSNFVDEVSRYYEELVNSVDSISKETSREEAKKIIEKRKQLADNTILRELEKIDKNLEESARESFEAENEKITKKEHRENEELIPGASDVMNM